LSFWLSACKGLRHLKGLKRSWKITLSIYFYKRTEISISNSNLFLGNSEIFSIFFFSKINPSPSKLALNSWYLRWNCFIGHLKNLRTLILKIQKFASDFFGKLLVFLRNRTKVPNSGWVKFLLACLISSHIWHIKFHTEK
jgi:hypothetical protein